MPSIQSLDSYQEKVFENQTHPVSFEGYLTKKELAQKLRLSQAYINILMRDEGLPFVKLGRAVRYPVGDVVSWLQKRRRP